MPRMVSARPVATWLTASPSVSAPKTADIATPATMPQQRADQGRAGEIGAGKAAGRAHDHHALDAEIEHAGALDDEFAGRRQQQRRRCGDHRQNDGFKQSHQAGP